MKIKIKDSLSQMINTMKETIDSIPEETTDKVIEKAPIFDELIKSTNAAVE